MLNNEKTIRFEDFAAVSQDGGDVLGKVLYYSLSSILIDRDELESLCDAVGFPKGRSNRTAMGDAFRSATGDIYERRVVKTDSGPQIFKVYCRDNKGGNASVISRELVKETVHEDTNEYRKLANITFNKTSKLFSYDNLVSDPFIDPLPYCMEAQRLFELYQNCAGRRQIETLLENYVDSMQAVKIGLTQLVCLCNQLFCAAFLLLSRYAVSPFRGGCALSLRVGEYVYLFKPNLLCKGQALFKIGFCFFMKAGHHVRGQSGTRECGTQLAAQVCIFIRRVVAVHGF